MPTSTLQYGISGALDYRYQGDSIIKRYLLQLDTPTEDPYEALSIGQFTATGDRIPVRGEIIAGTNAYAKDFSFQQSDTNKLVWEWTVNFVTPEPGQNSTEQAIQHPLFRPPEYDVEWVEYDEVLTQAYNIDDLPRGRGEGGNRPKDTLGPIVNSAGQEPIEPPMDFDRDAVLVIYRNVPDLGEALGVYANYKKTTNSDTVTLGTTNISKRRMRYLFTESLGLRTENNISYYRIVTKIRIQDTTDKMINNVGYNHWTVDIGGSGEEELRRYTVVDAEATEEARKGDPTAPPVKVPSSEPTYLSIDGDLAGEPQTIGYYHLRETPYNSLIY